MSKTRLGSSTFESGNACRATLEILRPSGVAVSFTWKSGLIADDEDVYNCLVLPEAVRLAAESIDQLAVCRAACLPLESEGVVERAGVTEDGETLWRGTEKGHAMRAARKKQTLIGLWSKLRSTTAFHWLRALRPDA